MYPLHSDLLETSCGQFLTKRSISHQTGAQPPSAPICLDSSLNIQEGSTALATHRISSAPVYDQLQGGFIGMLDYRDLAAYVLEVFHKIPKTGTHNFNATMEMGDIVKRAMNDKTTVPVKYVCNMSGLNPLVPVDANVSLLDAIREIASNTVHRVVIVEPVPNSVHRFLGVLSQSSINSFIAQKYGKLNRAKGIESPWPRGDQTVAELGLVRGNVVSISTEDTVLQALYVMHQNRISSVAIVDRSQHYEQLKGNIGVSDLKEILATRSSWKLLYENAYHFFMTLRKKQGTMEGDHIPSYVIRPDTSLISTIERIAGTHAHRIWVVEEVDRLAGVISLSDIMPLLLD